MTTTLQIITKNLYSDSISLNNKLGKYDLVELLIPYISKSRWKNFELENNKITDQDLKELCQVLQDREIEKLHLRGNDLTHNCIPDLSLLFRPSICALKSLGLSNNSLKDKGVKELVDVLMGNNTIVKLGLSDNQITDEGVCYLAEHLLPSSIIAHLWLSNNLITDTGLGGLISHLIGKSSNKLVTLFLDHNLISDAGVRKFCLAVRNTKLERVVVHRDEDQITQATHHELERILDILRSKWLDLLLTLCSVREIPRLGRSSVFRHLPLEIIQKLSRVLPTFEVDDEIDNDDE